jgi:hypothetical protein
VEERLEEAYPLTRSAGPSPRAHAFFVALAAFAYFFATTELLNDQFGRITLGYQWLTFGDRPFRDYFDAGFFGAAAWSIAGFRLAGGSLLGEVLLDCAAMAAGTAILFLLIRRASGSTALACAGAVIAAIAGPRLYDYDKVLFYPAGIWASWRFVDRPSMSRAAVAGVVAAAAAVLRWDSLIYLGAALGAAILASSLRDGRKLATCGAAALAGVLLVAGPVLLWVHSLAGLPEAVGQIRAYAAIEGARSALIDWLAVVRGDVTPRDLWVAITRRGWGPAWLFAATIVLLPICAMSARRARSLHPGHLLTVAATVLGIVLFVLRDPLPARLGGAIAPVIVMAVVTFVARRDHSRSRALTAAGWVLLVVSAIAAATSGAWSRRLEAAGVYDGPQGIHTRAAARWRMLSATPPALGLMPGDAARELTWYLRRCTPPGAPLLAAWFAPEIYYFAQRPFAGGMVVFFGGHWADRQSLIVERLRARRPAMVILQRSSYPAFLLDYRDVALHIDTDYEIVGSTAFQIAAPVDATFDVLLPKGTAITGRESTWGLPCLVPDV